MEKHHESARQKWGFDFRVGSPLPNASGKYVWERVDGGEGSTFVPEMYTLTRSAHVRPSTTHHATDDFFELQMLLDERFERENLQEVKISSAEDEVASGEEATLGLPLFFGKISTVSSCSTVRLSSAMGIASPSKRQPKITGNLD